MKSRRLKAWLNWRWWISAPLLIPLGVVCGCILLLNKVLRLDWLVDTRGPKWMHLWLDWTTKALK